MKNLFSSKTFYLAVLQALAGIIVVIQTNYPTIGWVVIAKSIIDIILRTLTGTPVSFGSKSFFKAKV